MNAVGEGKKIEFHEGEWGYLPEPCRYCRQMGVFFLIDEGPEGIGGDTTTRCPHCKRVWQASGTSA